MLLYANDGINTKQIAPLAIDENWGKTLPWHITYRNYHWVYDNPNDAITQYVKLRDSRDKFFEGQARVIGVDNASELSASEKPRIYQHTTTMQNDYINREYYLAKQVCADARRQFNNPYMKQTYGTNWESWHDCISLGLGRIRKYFPKLLDN